MGGFLIFTIALVAFAFFMLAAGVKIVKQSETMVVERLGKYHKTLSSGINIIIPIFDKPRQIAWRYTQQTVTGDIVSVFKIGKSIRPTSNY